MAETWVSNTTAKDSAVPLVGTEVVRLVQSGASKKATINDIEGHILTGISGFGDISFYDTKADADAALAGLAADAVVEIFADETRSGRRTRYRKEGGVYVFKVELVSVISDHKSRPVIPENLLINRTQGATLRRALRDLEDGVRTSLRMMAIGDSLGGFTWNPVNAQLQDIFGAWCATEPVHGFYVGRNYNATAAAGGTTTATGGARSGHSLATGSTGAVVSKTDYTIGWDGTYVNLDPGELAIIANGGNSIIADKLHIPLIREPGAGTVKIEIAESGNSGLGAASGLWRSPIADEIISAHTLTGADLLVDLDGAFACDVVQLSVNFNRWVIKVTHTAGAGDARTLFPMYEVTTQAAVNSWFMSQGSNDFVNVDAAAVPIFAAQIAAYQPDIIVVDSDDRIASYQAFLPLLEDSIIASGLAKLPLVVLVGNPGYLNGPFNDSDIIARTDYCWEFASSRVGWDVIDGIAISGGLAQLDAVGWDNDGIHLNDPIYREMARIWAVSRGYMAFQQLRPGGAVASIADIAASESARDITADRMHVILGSPFLQDTGPMTWSYLTTGTGAGTTGADNAMQLASGATAGSTVVAYINATGTPIGDDQGLRTGNLVGGFSAHARLTANTANGRARILWTGDRAYNAAHAGALTGRGVGFILEGNVIYGIAFHGVAEGKTSGSVTLVSGGAADWYDLQVVLTPRAIDASNGTAEFFVNGASLGTLSYLHTSTFGALRTELTNGADAVAYTLRVTKPRVVTVR